MGCFVIVNWWNCVLELYFQLWKYYGIFIGGMNFGVFDGCLIGEELARGCAGMWAALSVTGVAVSWLSASK